MIPETIYFRETVFPEDIEKVKSIISSTGMFSVNEIIVAGNLVKEKILHKENSEYFFIFAQSLETVLGYSCFGTIACTHNRFDLYWIAVHALFQNRGIGTMILQRNEQKIAALGGARIYIETSSQNKYEATRRFYYHHGYNKVAEIKGFYSDTDDKIVFEKLIG